MYKKLIYAILVVALIIVATTEAKGGRRSSRKGGSRSSFSSSSSLRKSSTNSENSSLRKSSTNSDNSGLSRIYKSRQTTGGVFNGFFHHFPYRFSYRPIYTNRGYTDLNDEGSQPIPYKEEEDKNKDKESYAVGYAISRSLSYDFYSVFNVIHDISKYLENIKTNKKGIITTTTEIPVDSRSFNPTNEAISNSDYEVHYNTYVRPLNISIYEKFFNVYKHDQKLLNILNGFTRDEPKVDTTNTLTENPIKSNEDLTNYYT